MTIQEIKNQIGLSTTLNFVRQFSNDDQKTPQPWVSHWDNEKRIRVVMHDDVLNTLKGNGSFNMLALKKEVVTPKEAGKEAYTRYVVITPKNIEASF